MVQIDPRLTELVESAFRPVNLPPKPDRERLHHLAHVDRVLAMGFSASTSSHSRGSSDNCEEKALETLWNTELIHGEVITDQMKRLWLEYGLPSSSVRKVMWPRIIVADDHYQQQNPIAVSVDIHSVLASDYEKLIQLDLERTLPFLGIFNKGPEKLRICADVLSALAHKYPSNGYTQGMSYICVRIALEMGFDHESTLHCLVRTIVGSPTLMCMYRLNREEMTRTVEFILDAIAWENIPQLWLRFKKMKFQIIDYFLIEWILTMFVKGFSLRVSGFIFDQFFLSGDIALYKGTIAILSLITEHVSDPNLDTESTRTIIINANAFITQFNHFVRAYHDVEVTDTVKALIQKGVTSLG